LNLIKVVTQKLHAGNVLLAMDADNNNKLNKLKDSLEAILIDYLERKLPLRRIVFLSSILKMASHELDSFKKVTKRIITEQKTDGGWVDCEDTAWNIFFLSSQDNYSVNRSKAIEWLNSERPSKFGWGFCKRDYSNIPITSQVLLLVPELRNLPEFKWIFNEWNKDINSPINLNYKGAWYLLLMSTQNLSLDYEAFNIKQTEAYLIQEQRDDGGWGPWKNHPAISDPFITGLCSLALSNSFKITHTKEILVSLYKSIKWFESNQLENGLFPTHYIEEGSAWCYFGWQMALNTVYEGYSS